MTSSRLYDRNFVLAMASQTCFVIANTLMAHYARWIDFLGGDLNKIGAIMGTGAIFGLLLRPWLGQWINRFGSKKMWFVGYLVFALSSLANLMLGGIGPSIYLVRAVLVLGGAIVFASSLTYITQTTPEDRRTEAIGILGAGGFMGMLVGPALGDLILGADDRTRHDFTVLFLTAGFANIVPAAMLCFMRSPTNKSPNLSVRLQDFFLTTWRNWPGTILLVDIVFGMCMTAPFVFLAKYIDDKSLLIPGVSVIGLFFWCYAGWAFLVRVLLRRTPERLGRRKVLLVGLPFMAAGMFCFWLVDKSAPWMIVVPALVTGTGHSLMFHTMTSLTIESFPHEVRGTGSALALMMLDLGMIAGAPILGAIAATYDYPWMFATIGTLAFVVAVAYTISSIPVWQQRREDHFAETWMDKT